jgi:hypothetical protein
MEEPKYTMKERLNNKRTLVRMKNTINKCTIE